MQVNIETQGEQSNVIVAPNINTVIALDKVAPEKRVVEEFLHYFPQIESSVIPPQLRYMSPDRKIICFEQRPKRITIPVIWKHMSDIEDSGGSNKFGAMDYTIPLPWLLYCALLSPQGHPLNIYVFVLKHQLESLDDELFAFPFLNFYPDSKLCRAPDDMEDSEFGPTIQGAISSIYKAVWLTGFNSDLSHHMMGYIQGGKVSALNYKFSSPNSILEQWSRKSLTDMAESSWPVLGGMYNSLETFLDGNILESTVTETFDMSRYFVSRVSSAYQNAE